MGPVVFPLSFCGTTAGNVIHIFFINDLSLYPFAVNQHGPFVQAGGGGGCRSTPPPPRGYDEGTAEWNNFDELGGLGAPYAHALSFRNEQEGGR